MGIQARNVVRLARKRGHTLIRGSYTTCAVGFLAQTVNNYYRSDLAETGKRIGVQGDEDRRYRILRAVERGFEDKSTDGSMFDSYFSAWPGVGKKERALLRRYFNVGRNIAKLAGLPFGVI